MVQLLKIIIKIDFQRPQVKIWFPGRIAKVSRDNITNQEFKDKAGPIPMGSAENPVSFESLDSSDSTLDGDEVSSDEFEKEKRLAEPPSTYVLFGLGLSFEQIL